MTKKMTENETGSFFSDDFVTGLERSSGGNYLNPSRLQDGQSVRFRIVSPAAVTGWEVWTDDNKPLRYREKPSAERLPAGVRRGKNGAPELKQFMAALVFSYEDDTFKLAQFTQKSLLQGIAQYAADEDYGHPSRYDMVLSRAGTGMDTKYKLTPKPPKAIDSTITARLADFPCRLDALFDGEDPFEIADGDPAF